MKINGKKRSCKRRPGCFKSLDVIGEIKSDSLMTNSITTKNILVDQDIKAKSIKAFNNTLPVIEGRRISESHDPISEGYRKRLMFSSLTSTRVSTKYGFHEMENGFGTDVSFQIVDKEGDSRELGVIGMVKSGTNSTGYTTADFVFNSWNVQNPDTFTEDWVNGDFEIARITYDGNLQVQNGIQVKKGDLKVQKGDLKVQKGNLRVQNGNLKVQNGNLKVKNGNIQIGETTLNERELKKLLRLI